MKKKLKIVLAVLIPAVLVILAAVFYTKVRSKEFLVNPLFLSADAVKGVDISSYQEEVDMQRLAAQNVSFVYIKATEGSSHEDPCFARNWANARESGMAYGAYHFFSFDSSGKSQAEHFIQTAGSLEGALVPVADVEFYGDKEANPPAREDVLRELRAFLDTLEEEYGAKPMIYCSKQIWQKYLKGEIAGYPIWVRSVYLPPPFDGWGDGEWAVWQYCDTGHLEGYTGEPNVIDLDVLNSRITLEDLKL